MAARCCYSGYTMHGQRIYVRFLHQTLLNLFTVLSILVPMLLVMLERVVVPFEQPTAVLSVADDSVSRITVRHQLDLDLAT